MFGEFVSVLSEPAEIDDAGDAGRRRGVGEVFGTATVPLLESRPSFHRVDEVVGRVDRLPIPLEGGRERRRFEQISLDDPDVGGGRSVPVRVTDKHHDLMAGVEQRRDQSAADESGRTGDENAHDTWWFGRSISPGHDAPTMEAGEFEAVNGVEDLYVHDTGMFDTDEYGSIYVYDAERPAVIDTGTGANRELVFETLTELGVGREDLAWILPTHAHLDHAGGVGYLAERYPNAAVRLHERGVRHLVEPDALIAGTKAAVKDQWQHYAEPKPVPAGRIDGVVDGDRIDLGDRELVVHEAPGHAPHHVVYHEPDAGVVFTADAAGIYVPAIDAVRETTPPPQFDLDQCLRDIEAIAELDPGILCFGHFGPRSYERSLVESAKRAYVEWIQAVRVKREELGDDDAVVEHFETASADVDYWNAERARAEAGLNTRGALTFLDRVNDDPDLGGSAANVGG